MAPSIKAMRTPVKREDLGSTPKAPVRLVHWYKGRCCGAHVLTNSLKETPADTLLPGLPKDWKLVTFDDMYHKTVCPECQDDSR